MLNKDRLDDIIRHSKQCMFASGAAGFVALVSIVITISNNELPGAALYGIVTALGLSAVAFFAIGAREQTIQQLCEEIRKTRELSSHHISEGVGELNV